MNLSKNIIHPIVSNKNCNKRIEEILLPTYEKVSYCSNDETDGPHILFFHLCHLLASDMTPLTLLHLPRCHHMHTPVVNKNIQIPSSSFVFSFLWWLEPYHNPRFERKSIQFTSLWLLTEWFLRFLHYQIFHLSMLNKVLVVQFVRMKRPVDSESPGCPSLFVRDNHSPCLRV